MSVARWTGAAVLAASAAALIGCASVPPDEPPSQTDVPGSAVSLTVRVVGAESSSGWIAVAIYGSPEAFADRRDPAAAARLEVKDGGAVWRVPVLGPGQYAVAVFHDADADGELDRSAVGVPTERYGFSNDARGRFGPPSYSDAAVTLGDGAHELVITLR